MDEIKFEEVLGYIESEELSQYLDRFGHLRESKKENYEKLYNLCENINSKTKYKSLTQAKTTRLKGKILETILKATFEWTGGYFETFENLGTATNEIDLYFRLTNKGKMFLGKLINKRFERVICECKNYNKGVGVTYIGKFYSLMVASNRNTGLFVSWKGLAGKKWDSSKGLVKKIYLLNENKEDKVYILEFKKDDFKSILDGKSIFEILNNKIDELEMDISFEKYFTRHPNQDELEEKAEIILSEQI